MEENTQKSNTIDFSVLRLFQKFAGSEPDMGKIWFGSEMIVSTQPKRKALFYIPKTEMFTEEFGTSNLRNFVSLISLLDDIDIEFKMPEIYFIDKNAGSMVSYKSASKTSFKVKLNSNNAAKKLRNISKKLIQEGKYFKFKLTYDLLSKVMTAGSTIGTGSTKVSTVNFIKERGDDSLIIQVSNEEAPNMFNKTISECENAGNIETFNHTVMVNRFLSLDKPKNEQDNADWDVYIFDGSCEHLGKKIPITWTYLVSDPFEMIIVYTKDKKR